MGFDEKGGDAMAQAAPAAEEEKITAILPPLATAPNTPSTDAATAVEGAAGETPLEGQGTPGDEISTIPSPESPQEEQEQLEGEEEEEMAVFITVHPPRLPSSSSSSPGASSNAAQQRPLVLDPLAGVELVMQVRQVLAEIPQTCLFSAFRLLAVVPPAKSEEAEGESERGVEDVWEGEGEVMNDFVELRSIAAVAARPERVEVRMELDPYNIHTARQHVQKFRELLRYPPPCPDGIGPGAKASNGKKGKGKGGGGGKNKKAKEGSAATNSNATAAAKNPVASANPGEELYVGNDPRNDPGNYPGNVQDDDSATEAMVERVQRGLELRSKRALEIRSRLKDSKVPVGGEGLGSFYGVGLGLAVEEVSVPSKEETGGGKGGDKNNDSPILCLRGVSVSAWNPPPPQRKMVGDLMYLEITALDGTVIHVTCTQGGFYVNGTRRDNFDPTPASNNPCHSHELAACLLASNPSFAKAWNNAVTQAWKRTQADDPVHALARAMREGRGDAVMVKPQWNMPVPDPKWAAAAHKADPSRAQEDLSSGFGMEDRGVPREWNDEYQCLLELPNDTPEQIMTRSRALHKLLCDFQEAATAGALAISDGHIPAANPTEAEHSHVFVFNNIFFSYAADSPDAYKAVEGEAAARKSASQDLASVVALNLLAEAFHPQLAIKTLATAVIDYTGRRLIAQSLVPGILNGDQTNKVVYGAMEHGQSLRQDNRVASLLKGVGQRLMIAEREVDAVPIKKPPATLSNSSSSSSSSPEESGSEGTGGVATATSATTGVSAEGGGDGENNETVRITGAVEMKGIIGSDNRSYLLDVSRLTPRDANWVRGEKGTGVFNEWMARAQGDKPATVETWEEGGKESPVLLDISFEQMTVLRPELLTMFTRHKVAEWFRGRNSPEASNNDNKAIKAEGEEAIPVTPPQDGTPAIDKETIVPVAETAAGADGAVVTAVEIEGDQGTVCDDKAGVVVEGGGQGEEKGGGEIAVLPKVVEGGEGEGDEGEGVVDPMKMSEEELAKLKVDQEEKMKELAMNVNVFMPYKGCADEKQLLADESLAREAARYLWEVALPFVTVEIKRGSVCPLDCAELATVLHGAGINLRYMGRLATVAVAEEAEDAAIRAEGKLRRWRMPLFWLEMLETEMVARAASHVFNRYMAAGTTRARLAPGRAVQQFLNCLLGGSNKADIKETPTTSNGSSPPSSAPFPTGVSSSAGTAPSDSSWMPEDGEIVALSSDGLWESVAAEVGARFRHKLVLWGRHEQGKGAESAKRAHKLPLLRRVCQRLGLRVLSKSYVFNDPEPFAIEDIVSVYPVVKSCVPASPAPDAGETLEMAQLHLTSGSGLQTAHDFAHHAATMLLQACDGMHSKYPAALNLQARVMYHSGDADAAVALELKALAYFEQLEGLDSAAVVKCHEHLGQYFILAGLYDKALAHMRGFCYLVEMTAGPNHPDLANGYHRMGKAYQDVGSPMMALRCYQEALERQAGDHMVNPRIHHSVAETLEAMQGYTDALKHERLSHAGYKAVHGEKHPMVAMSTQNIRALTTKIVKAAQDLKKPPPAQKPPALSSPTTSGTSTPSTSNSTTSSSSRSSIGSNSSDGDANSKPATSPSGVEVADARVKSVVAPVAEPPANGASVTKVSGDRNGGGGSGVGEGGGGGGVEESKINWPIETGGGGGGGGKNKSSTKKKNRR